MAGKRYVARETFGINIDGEQITVGQGEVLNTGNKTAAAIIKQLGKNPPQLEDFASFGRFDVEDAPRKVEQATAAPGEKRGSK